MTVCHTYTIMNKEYIEEALIKNIIDYHHNDTTVFKDILGLIYPIYNTNTGIIAEVSEDYVTIQVKEDINTDTNYISLVILATYININKIEKLFYISGRNKEPIYDSTINNICNILCELGYRKI